MAPSKIMIIRHAEKPNSEPGIMPDGAVNPEALTATGWKRANALVGLFDPAGGASPRLPLAKPTRLFASGSESLRPVQTITPLAAALGNLPINTAHRKNQLDKLVVAAKNGEGASLIAWQHEDIPAIAALILAAPAASRRNGPAAASISSGCSTGWTARHGASRRCRNSFCRVTPRRRSGSAAS